MTNWLLRKSLYKSGGISLKRNGVRWKNVLLKETRREEKRKWLRDIANNVLHVYNFTTSNGRFKKSNYDRT